MGRHILHEMHSALSAPSPENQRLGKSGCLIKGVDSAAKSAVLECNTSSIRLNDRSPPTSIIVAPAASLRDLAPGRK